MLHFFAWFCFKFLVSINVCPCLALCQQTHKISSLWTHSQGCCQVQVLSLCASPAMEKPSHRLFAVYLLNFLQVSSLWLMHFLSLPVWMWGWFSVLQFKLHLSLCHISFVSLFCLCSSQRFLLLQAWQSPVQDSWPWFLLVYFASLRSSYFI